MAEKYILELTRKQAEAVKDACELYARLKIGQFERITEMLLDVQNAKDYCERRDLANDALKVATNHFTGCAPRTRSTRTSCASSFQTARSSAAMRATATERRQLA